MFSQPCIRGYLLGYKAPSLGNRIPTFRSNLASPLQVSKCPGISTSEGEFQVTLRRIVEHVILSYADTKISQLDWNKVVA